MFESQRQMSKYSSIKVTITPLITYVLLVRYNYSILNESILGLHVRKVLTINLNYIMDHVAVILQDNPTHS